MCVNKVELINTIHERTIETALMGNENEVDCRKFVSVIIFHFSPSLLLLFGIKEFYRVLVIDRE